MGSFVFPLTNEQNPVYFIPLNSQGMVITVLSGGYNMTGLTAKLLLNLNTQPAQNPAVVVTLTLTVQPGGLSASYTTLGTEFTTAGLYDAQIKLTGSGLLLYSAAIPKLIFIQSVFA